jgi:formylglycine-generating enzyme required for sulfatase activity
VAAYVGEVNEGETITAGTFYVDPAIDNLRVTLNWPGSNLDLELFNPNGRQVDFGASNVIYSGDTKPEYVIIKDPQSGYWTAKVYGKSIGSSEEYYVLVTKYVPEPTMDIQAEIRNIWTSDIISPIVLFGKDANLGQVLQADLDDDLFSDPLPSYDDRCLGDKNYDKSVISRFGEGDDKVRIVLDITGGTGFKPGSEGYIKILNPEYKITKIYGHSDYVGVQPPTMSLGTPTISTDYSGFGVVIDMEEGSVSWQGRGTCPACACRENTFRMEFLVEKVSIPADSVIFADDFDTYATGSFPSSGAWNLKYNGMGDSYQIVDNAQSVSPPNSLKLEGEANWAASADHPLAETPDYVTYEVDVKVTQPGSSVMNYHDAAIGLENPNIGTWGTRYAGVNFGNVENRVIQPGNIPFNFDQWYHIKVKADMNNGVYDVWLDDQLIASDISTSSNGDYTDIRLEGGNNAHTRVWFDNVNVYRGHYPSQYPNGGLNGVPDGNTITNTIGMEFVPIPPGEFEMGSPSDEEGRWSAEGPVHHVNIGYAFYMGRYGVTQKQWRAIMGDNPSYFKGDNLPVEQVSWYDAQEFIKKLNEKEITDKYRLPSEAEWEYACRAGTTSRYSFGNSESKLGDYAWYSDNSGDKTHPVGQKKPNSWELYDMYGNVREWVQDSWHDDYDGAPTDGSAWESGDSTFRVDRGGSWRINVKVCRSAFRGRYVQSSRYRALGFRLLREQ